MFCQHFINMHFGKLEGTLIHAFFLDPGDCSILRNLGQLLSHIGAWEGSKLFHSDDANGGCAAMFQQVGVDVEEDLARA